MPQTVRAVERRRLLRLPRSHVDGGQKARDERRQAAASISGAKSRDGGCRFLHPPSRVADTCAESPREPVIETKSTAGLA